MHSDSIFLTLFLCIITFLVIRVIFHYFFNRFINILIDLFPHLAYNINVDFTLFYKGGMVNGQLKNSI